MNEKIYKALSSASTAIMKKQVAHIVITWTTKDGMINTVYDKGEDDSFIEMIGALELVKTRILHNYAKIPELDNTDEDNE